MGLNTTGLPNTDDYLLGRGTLYICELDDNGLPLLVGATGGWRDLGNGPSFKLSQSSTKIDHKSSRSGLATIDKSIVTEQKLEATIEIDEFNFQNLALALAGETAAPTNAAIAGFANYTMIGGAGVALGRWYDLQSSTGVRVYDVDVADLTVKKTGGAALVEGTGYIADTKMGRIFFPTAGGTIVAGDTIDVTVTADAGAATLEAVRALTSTPIARALKFIGENPANANQQIEIQIHKIALAADGDLGFISDDIAKMTLKGVCEINEAADEDSPYFTIVTHANAHD